MVYDYGYKNPTSILFAASDADGKVFVYDIIYAKETSIEDLAMRVHEKLKNSVDYTFLADPSIQRTERDGNTIAGEWDDYGIEWEPAKNDKRAGYDRVARYLTPYEDDYVNLVFFDVPQMQSLKDEIMDYKWRELKYGSNTRPQFEEAVKVNDHAMDCLKYLIHYVEDASEPVKKDYEFDWYEIMRNEETWMSV